MAHTCDVCGADVSDWSSSTLIERYRVPGISEVCRSCMKPIEKAGRTVPVGLHLWIRAGVMVAIANLVARKIRT